MLLRLPVSAPPVLVRRRLIEALAVERGEAADALAARLFGRTLDAAEHRAERRLLLRRQALDALKALLHAPLGSVPHSDSDRGGRSGQILAGLGADDLRAALDAQRLPPRRMTAALAQVDASSLRRLALLLAPRAGAARAAFRRALSAAAGRRALAALVAALLAGEDVAAADAFSAMPRRPLS